MEWMFHRSKDTDGNIRILFSMDWWSSPHKIGYTLTGAVLYQIAAIPISLAIAAFVNRFCSHAEPFSFANFCSVLITILLVGCFCVMPWLCVE